MTFNELNINNDRIIRPGIPYVENSKESQLFEFNIVKYGSAGDGKSMQRYTLATIDMTHFMSNTRKTKSNWETEVLQELLRRIENLGFKGSAIDPGVIEKLLG